MLRILKIDLIIFFMASQPELRPENVKFIIPPVLLEYAYENPRLSLASWFFNDGVLRAHKEACEEMKIRYPQLENPDFKRAVWENLTQNWDPKSPECIIKGIILGGI